MYVYRSDLDKNDFLDGRPITYLSRKMPYCREFVSDILRHKRGCSYKRVLRMMEICQPTKKVSDYFVKIEEEG